MVLFLLELHLATSAIVDAPYHVQQCYGSLNAENSRISLRNDCCKLCLPKVMIITCFFDFLLANRPTSPLCYDLESPGELRNTYIYSDLVSFAVRFPSSSFFFHLPQQPRQNHPQLNLPQTWKQNLVSYVCLFKPFAHLYYISRAPHVITFNIEVIPCPSHLPTKPDFTDFEVLCPPSVAFFMFDMLILNISRFSSRSQKQRWQYLTVSKESKSRSALTAKLYTSTMVTRLRRN